MKEVNKCLNGRLKKTQGQRSHKVTGILRLAGKASTRRRPVNSALGGMQSNPSLGSRQMNQSLGLVSFVVREYDEALAFFVDKLGFELVEDQFVPEQDKRWVVIKPPGAGQGAQLLLARASNPEQVARIGSQTGGRVFLFLYTDDFWRDYTRFKTQDIEFVRDPAEQPYGTVAVFKDLYGNLWDLVQMKQPSLGEQNAA